MYEASLFQEDKKSLVSDSKNHYFEKKLMTKTIDAIGMMIGKEKRVGKFSDLS